MWIKDGSLSYGTLNVPIDGMQALIEKNLWEAIKIVEKIGLEAIILHEQASSGMTIIEKIEHYSNDADFALVLYTPCD